MQVSEWRAEAERRFGADPLNWRFKCPSCGHVASIRDWQDAGAPETAVAFSCIGRWSNPKNAGEIGGKKQPCNYAGGGLFKLNPVEVDGMRVFAFAEES